MDTAKEFRERIAAKIKEAYNELASIGTKYGEYRDSEDRRRADRERHAERWKSWTEDRRKEFAGHLAELDSKRLALMLPNYRDARIDVRTFAAIEINNALQVDASLTESTLEHFRFAINADRSSEYLFSLAARLENLTPLTPDEAKMHAEIKRILRAYQDKIGLTAIEQERQEWMQLDTPLKKFEAEIKLGLFNPSNLQDLSKVLMSAGLAE